MIYWCFQIEDLPRDVASQGASAFIWPRPVCADCWRWPWPPRRRPWSWSTRSCWCGVRLITYSLVSG